MRRFARKLAIHMTNSEVTQITTNVTGRLWTDHSNLEKGWVFDFFNEVDKDADYREEIRKSLPLTKQNRSY